MIRPRSDAGNLLLPEALCWRALGLSILTIKEGKKPAIRSWTASQQQAADEAQIREWFHKPHVEGLGIILGPVSGHLPVERLRRVWGIRGVGDCVP